MNRNRKSNITVLFLSGLRILKFSFAMKLIVINGWGVIGKTVAQLSY